jgi:histone deacetylase 6
MLFVWLQKRVRLQKELTFQDLYENQELFDEEDDDEDSDWDPSQLQMCVEVIKWFCKNCTVDNINNDVCCRVCL